MREYVLINDDEWKISSPQIRREHGMKLNHQLQTLNGHPAVSAAAAVDKGHSVEGTDNYVMLSPRNI